MDIEEVLKDVKKTVGDKGMIVILVVIVVIFVYGLVRKDSTGNSESNTYIVPSGYTSYPDAVTNANVIVDEVNRNTNYNSEVLKDLISSNFKSTNDYINNGIADIRENMDKNFTDIDNDLSDITKKVTSIGSSVGKNQSLINKLQTTLDKKQLTTIQQSNAKNYYAKTPYTGVSIVDGLKATGVYYTKDGRVDDWHAMKATAEANGIKNFTGTAEQNLYMLDLLKKGQLVKPS